MLGHVIGPALRDGRGGELGRLKEKKDFSFFLTWHLRRNSNGFRDELKR
jgi:hypothetical protein